MEKIISACEVENDEAFAPKYEFTLPKEVQPGENITIIFRIFRNSYK